MYAIVLTFDKQIGFAELVYKKYQKLWPGCPLTFRIPFNDPETPLVSYFRKQNNVELVETPPDIRSTMFNLLKGINDNEWVYWCIDDRYPISMNSSEVDYIYRLTKDLPKNIDRVKLFRWKERVDGGCSIGEKTFFKQVHQSVWGFWHHSFLRAKILKVSFLTKRIPTNYKIRHVNAALIKDPIIRPKALSNTIISSDNLITFGEPCVKGCLTQNGLRELKRYECTVPKYSITGWAKSFLHKDTTAKHLPRE